MLNIILTIDYEIFGDGVGDVQKHMIKPTDDILKLCEKYAVPLTIMFEVNEYQKFEEYDSALFKDLGYSPAKKIKDQVCHAYQKGHDIQLHIHPQWLDAEYKDNRWIMKNPNQCITEFSEKEIDQIIFKGKQTVENIIHEIDKKFSVCAMRLTNLPWVEAPVEVHNAMINNKICYHSLSISDSQKNNKKGFWPLDAEESIFEIPIHSVTMPGFKRFTWDRIKTAIYRQIYTRNSIKSYSEKKQNKFSKFKKIKDSFNGLHPIKWDFCKQSCQQMINFLDYGMARYDYKRYEVPLVMISHSKDFFNSRHLELFFKTVKNRYCKTDNIRFTTMAKFKRDKKKEKCFL